jgi:hypothetical protein
MLTKKALWVMEMKPLPRPRRPLLPPEYVTGSILLLTCSLFPNDMDEALLLPGIASFEENRDPKDEAKAYHKASATCINMYL